MAALLGAALASSLMLTRGPAAAAELSASIAWQGECDDRASLHAELASRGVHLSEAPASENVSNVSVLVQKTPAHALVADVLLVARGAQEQRRVEARECAGLRRALAWLLWALAEERQAAERSGEPSPSVPPIPSIFAEEVPAPSLASPPRAQPSPSPVAREPRVEVRPRRREPCGYVGPRVGLGGELVVAFGMLDTAALGPALVGSYRPCARSLPLFTLGASRLQTVGYEVAERSVSLVRTSAQLGAWFELVGPILRAGLAFEAGRLRASGAARGEARGLASSAPWLAFVAPLRLAVPLVTRVLTLEAGLAAAYTPQAFTLRYASGDVLARPRHFELRGSFGLAGHF